MWARTVAAWQLSWVLYYATATWDCNQRQPEVSAWQDDTSLMFPFSWSHHKPNSENCAIKGNLHPLFWNIWDVLNDFGDDVLVDALVFVVGFRWLCAMQKSQRDSVMVVFNRRIILTTSNIPLYCHPKKKGQELLFSRTIFWLFR